MPNNKYNKTEDMIEKLQALKGKTKLKIFQSLSNFHKETIYRRRGGCSQCEEIPTVEMLNVMVYFFVKWIFLRIFWD